MLRALTQSACDDDDAAVETIAAALAAAPETDGYLRLFLDEGPAMAALLQQVARLPASSGLHHSSALAQHLLRVADRGDVAGRTFATRGDDGRAGSPPLFPSSLSEREQEVLRLLQSDLTGPEIARHLYISLNTLRTHTKRIFSKLGVTSRAAAVRRAREHQLL
jgi:LuxR family maltose regulon positive regulatory protein